jgi:hypothetical protein
MDAGDVPEVSEYGAHIGRQRGATDLAWPPSRGTEQPPRISKGDKTSLISSRASNCRKAETRSVSARTGAASISVPVPLSRPANVCEEKCRTTFVQAAYSIQPRGGLSRPPGITRSLTADCSLPFSDRECFRAVRRRSLAVGTRASHWARVQQHRRGWRIRTARPVSKTIIRCESAVS